MNDRRLQRLESTIKAKVATALARDMSDPRLGLVTVTRVKLDRELTLCKVYWSVLGGEKERKVNERVLEHATGWMRREVASVLQTRTVPRVEFVFDESIIGAMRVETLIKTLRAEREARGETLEPGDEDGERANADETGGDGEAGEDDGPGPADRNDDDPDDDDSLPTDSGLR